MGQFEWMELETHVGEIAHLKDRLATARSTKNHGLARWLEQEIEEAERRRSRLVEFITTKIVSPGAARRSGGSGRGEVGDKSGRGHSGHRAEVKADVKGDRPPLRDDAVEDAPASAVAVAEADLGLAPDAVDAADQTVVVAGDAVAAEPAGDAAAVPETSGAELTAGEVETTDPAEAEGAADRTPELQVASGDDLDDSSIASGSDRVELEALPNDAAAPPEPAPIAEERGVATVWEKLTPADIEQAKRDLSLRRAETLARHMEELNALDSEQAEIDTLDQAIEAFTRKFRGQDGEIVQLADSRLKARA